MEADGRRERKEREERYQRTGGEEAPIGIRAAGWLKMTTRRWWFHP